MKINKKATQEAGARTASKKTFDRKERNQNEALTNFVCEIAVSVHHQSRMLGTIGKYLAKLAMAAKKRG